MPYSSEARRCEQWAPSKVKRPDRSRKSTSSSPSNLTGTGISLTSSARATGHQKQRRYSPPKVPAPTRTTSSHVISLGLIMRISPALPSFHYLTDEFSDRFPVPHLRSPQTNIFNVLLPLQRRGQMLFRNIFTQRVLSRVFRAGFLNSYLTFARQEPINENLGGIGMRRFVHQGKHRTAGFETDSVPLKRMGVKNIHRQSLIFRFFDFGRFGG